MKKQQTILAGGYQGVANISRLGISREFNDFYHVALQIPWWLFFICFAVGYLLINSFFAALYYYAGDQILNANPESYWDAFFFSFQTSATIGYGYLAPKTTLANVIVIFDTISGLLFVTLSTGLAFAKFSRPTSKVIFSDKIIYTQMNGKKYLMLRIANGRRSHIIDAFVSLTIVKAERSPEGIEMRRLYDLKLVRDRSPIFVLSWTIMHEIDEGSPLFGISFEELKKLTFTFVVTFHGREDVFSQTVFDRYIYSQESLEKAKKFADITRNDEKGSVIIDYSQFHLTEL